MMNFYRQQDKQLHMVGCFALTIVFSLALQYLTPCPHQVLYAWVTTLAIGGLKELYDYCHPLTHTADEMDFLADVIGASAAAALLLLAGLL